MSNGERLIDKIHSTIKSMDLNCHRVDGRQIELQRFYQSARRGEHFEIDMVCLVDSVCIFIEVTTQTDNNKEKITRDFFMNLGLYSGFFLLME